MSEEISKGDIVRLKSGGPKMTVIGITPQSAGWGAEAINCKWFPTNEKPETDSFPRSALELANTGE